MDTDDNVQVEMTGPSRSHCIWVKLGDIEVEMHVRSAVDLSQKLQKAILNWIAAQYAELIVLRS
jgi:hypothetical protein